MPNFILANYFDIHNSNDGKYITINIDGKIKKRKTIFEIADDAYSITQKLFASEEYLNSDTRKAIENSRINDNKDLKEAFVNQFVTEITTSLAAKKEKRDEYIKNALPSAFNTSFIPASFKPADDINDVDLFLIDNIYYNEAQDALYYKHGNSFIYIGSLTEVTEPGSTALYKLTSCINKNLSIKLNVESFSFWQYLYKQVNKVTEDFFRVKQAFEGIVESNLAVHDDSEISNLSWPTPLKLKDFADPKTNRLYENWYDRLHSYFVKCMFKYTIPASGVNNDLFNLYYENLNDDTSAFKRYAVKSTHGKKCSFETYISKLFSERYAIVSKIKKLKEIPHVISDDGTLAEFSYDSKWLDKLDDQVEEKDAKILKAFLEPYTTEERIAIMAWAYTVIHPSLNDNIHFLFMTGGGTFKTNYYTAMISDILKLAYNSTRDLTHTMQRDHWINDAFLRESSTTGISNSALVNCDESTDKCLDHFKAMSGGTSEGINYQKRMMRETPIMMKIYCKWLFTTNNFFSIDDDSGAFERRLLIVNRMDIKNLPKPYLKATDFIKNKKTEIKAFYELSKKAYNKVLEKAVDLQDYVQKTDLRRNLSIAYNEDDKLMAYYELYNTLYEDLGEQKKFIKNLLVVEQEMFNNAIEEVCKNACIQVAGLKKWIKNTSDTEYECKYANAGITKKDKNNNERLVICKCWQLSPLKREVLDRIRNDALEQGISNFIKSSD